MKPTTALVTMNTIKPHSLRIISRRIAEAQHMTTNTAEAIFLYDHYDPDRDAREIIKAAARDASTALRARYRTSAQKIMDDLNREIPHDMRRFGIADYNNSEQDKRSGAAAKRKDADRAESISNNTKNSHDDRQAAKALQHTLEYEAAEDSAEAQDMSKKQRKSGHTDAADIIQDAALARIESLHRTGAQDYHASINAAGAGITAIAANKGYAATRTKVKSITAAQLAALKTEYPMYITGDDKIIMDKIPFPVLGRSTGYYSAEYRNTEKYKSGFYLVSHYATVAPIRLDDFAKGTKDEERTTLAETLKELHSHDQSEAEKDHQPQLEALIAAANLTERERKILHWATDDKNPVSIAIGVQAADVYMRTIDAKAEAAESKRRSAAIRTQGAKRIDIIRQRARLNAAMTAHDVPQTDSARWKVKSRIKLKLEAAQVFAPYWDIIDEAAAIKPAKQERIDLLGAQLAKLEQLPAAAPMIDWKRKPYAQDTHTITAEEAATEDKLNRAHWAYIHMMTAARTAAPTTAATVIEYTRSQRTPETICTIRQAASAAYSAWILAEGLTEAEFVAAYMEQPEGQQKQHKPSKKATSAAQEAKAAALEARLARWEAKQAEREAAAAAEEAQKAAKAERCRKRYNEALKASLKAMRTTWAAATEEQRSRARMCAEAARRAESKR